MKILTSASSIPLAKNHIGAVGWVKRNGPNTYFYYDGRWRKKYRRAGERGFAGTGEEE